MSKVEEISVQLFLLKSMETLTKIKVRFYHVVLVVTVEVHGLRALDSSNIVWVFTINSAS